MKLPRLSTWLAIAVVLLCLTLVLFPQQLGVLLFKVTLIATAGVAGYYLDRSLFPYARPDGYLAETPVNRYDNPLPSDKEADFRVNEGYHLVFSLAMIRRALIVGCAMLAVGLGA
ncbi:putative holin [Methylomonas sp. SURF-2]|uniref:Holin n=1 Tax=Methylomonas subterranea TaxID=2952225 RepID=A0ABT1TDT7_9GAMM|nr:putative holin [Methylomonas sp. SURF-2]MCQ8103277.1 putative holin [Methylomonas sp. SURF-2]